MLILTAESCTAIGQLIGCIAAYNCQLRFAQLTKDVPQPVLLSDLRAKWSAVCDAAVDLKHISGLEVVIGGAGSIYNGYNRAVQVQLLDSADVVRMVIDITYDGQHYVTDTKYY